MGKRSNSYRASYKLKVISFAELLEYQNKTQIKTPTKKIRIFYALRFFSGQNRKKSAQITLANTVYYQLDDRRFGVSFTAGARNFFHSRSAHAASRSHLSSYTIFTKSVFPWAKTADASRWLRTSKATFPSPICLHDPYRDNFTLTYRDIF